MASLPSLAERPGGQHFNVSRQQYNHIVHGDELYTDDEEDSDGECYDIADEKNPLTLREQQIYIRHRRRESRHSASLVANLLLCLTLIGLGIWHFLYVLRQHDPRTLVAATANAEDGIPTKAVTWDRHEIYANRSHPDSDLAWGNLSPAGDGFIVVKDAEMRGLPQGKDSSQGPMYDVSVFHQIHCLRMIRTYLYSVLDIANSHERSDAIDMFLKSDNNHVDHCFDYIRQALMCNADMTLEWPRVGADGSRFEVDGWGVTHQCKDWGKVLDWMHERRFRQPWEQE